MTTRRGREGVKVGVSWFKEGVGTVGELEDRGRAGWPFEGLPGLSEWLWCCHCGRMFVFSDAVVLKVQGEDWLECPYEGCDATPLEFFTEPERRLPAGQAPGHGVEVW